MDFNFDFDMEEMEGFEDFDDDSLKLLEEEEKKEKEKEKKKAKTEKKASGKAKSTTKKTKTVKFALPVTIKAPRFTRVVNAEGEFAGKTEATETELKKFLAGAGYEEARSSAIRLISVGDVAVMAISISSASSPFIMGDAVKKTGVSFDADPVTVADNMINAQYFAEQFPELDSDEIGVTEVVNKFVESNPEYEDVPVVFCPESNTVIFSPVETKLSFPCTINFSGETEDFMEEQKASDLVTRFYDGYAKAGITVTFAKIGETIFPVFKTSTPGISAGGENKKAKQKVERYTLPLNVACPAMVENQTFAISSDMFDGKDKVSLEDILDFFAAAYPSFDKRRKAAAGDKSSEWSADYKPEFNQLDIYINKGRCGSLEMLQKNRYFFR